MNVYFYRGIDIDTYRHQPAGARRPMCGSSRIIGAGRSTSQTTELFNIYLHM